MSQLRYQEREDRKINQSSATDYLQNVEKEELWNYYSRERCFVGLR